MLHRIQPEPDRHRFTGWPQRAIGSVAAAAIAASLALAVVSAAQDDGTGGAPPLEETSCVLVPASDIDDLRAAPTTEPVAATPAGATPADASPVAATPVGATPAASPVPSTPVAETPGFDIDLLTRDLTATSTSITSCLTEGRFLEAAERVSPIFRGQLVGNGRPLPANLFASIAATFPATEYHVLEIANVALLDDTTASADIVWQAGHQVRVDRWYFSRQQVQGLDIWMVDRAEPGTVTPARDAAPIDVTIADDRYALDPTRINGDAVEFRVTNRDATDHELLVLRLDDGVTTGTLLTTPGPALPEGVTFIGQATIASGAEGRLLLADLEPGTYTIVCLLPGENGVPHLADGMESTFEVAG